MKEFSKLQFCFAANKEEYLFEEEDVEEIKFDYYNVKAAIEGGYDLKDIDEYYIMDIIYYSIDDKNNCLEVIDVLIEYNNFTKEDIIRIWTENEGPEEIKKIYMILEEETWIYGPTVENLSEEDIKIYLKYANDSSGEFYEYLLKGLDQLDYYLKKIIHACDINKSRILVLILLLYKFALKLTCKPYP